MEAERPARTGVITLLILVGVAGAIYGIDQLSKQYVVSTLAEGRSFPSSTACCNGSSCATPAPRSRSRAA
ncbi:hypothetical protein [Agromyces marinus]|uniref:hypothetical protein n=1 Tax=Agromyces marinus TaxID=1389020 RepID=UPI0025742628|nr:hypothetical protein [Agromyces marinus]